MSLPHSLSRVWRKNMQEELKQSTMAKEIHVCEEVGMKGYGCQEQADFSADVPERELVAIINIIHI